MKKIAILGCENSHADAFLNFIYNTDSYRDVEVVGVYSNEPEAVKKLNEKYGVNILENYDDAVGKIDGLIVTARHGDLHYEYAKPYIESGIPMFIDKPVTIKEDEALEFMRVLKEKGIQAVGGSSLKHDKGVKALKKERLEDADGKTLGGFVRAPIDMASVYGGFYFYSQHLVETTLEIFGYYPKSVKAYTNGNIITVMVRYEDYDVMMEFTDGSWKYYAYVSTDDGVFGGAIDTSTGSVDELKEYYGILNGEASRKGYREFIAPVFVMNAVLRSIESGNEEAVNPAPEI